MRASVLKKKYPQVWESVYDTMVFDICEALAPINVEITVQTKIVERLAHNAAFLAVNELHKSRASKE